MKLSATMSGVSDVKDAIRVAKNEQTMFRRKTILFIDEIHRFNKLQQVCLSMTTELVNSEFLKQKYRLLV